ncbi:hypothetical protein AXF42_Ash020667 [Apostasia shenzhenica]|uniref:Uncharacterized protein n=1 Tax=Apostasia shenzhenica TaxID=1088818 RepID=A0A2H9ZW36_9ASPA|nr:hypothetical protein AXF42_Ash020667 [Apostasia shenzhenica]
MWNCEVVRKELRGFARNCVAGRRTTMLRVKLSGYFVTARPRLELLRGNVRLRKTTRLRRTVRLHGTARLLPKI